MKKLRILIVDDLIEDVNRAAALLKAAGHDVAMASNGREGVNMAKAQRPDLILMDVVMPGLNGFQATRELNRDENTKDIPVIVVSGKDQETDRVWAMRQGARAYITKAVEKKALFDAIDAVMA
jgi:twitching motility two-component system response regulator PilH